MSKSSTAVQDSSAPSPQPIVESPEVVAAREKSAAAGYERNRAELTYNNAKKEHGVDSPEAKAAKEVLTKAQAEVEKAQGELRDALKLNSTKSAPPPKAESPKALAPKPTAPKADAPKTPHKSPPEEVQSFKVPVERPHGAYLEHHILKVYRSEESIRINPLFKNDKDLKKRIDKLLKDIKADPKLLENFQPQNNGEMMLLESSSLLEKRSAPKLEKR